MLALLPAIPMRYAGQIFISRPAIGGTPAVLFRRFHPEFIGTDLLAFPIFFPLPFLIAHSTLFESMELWEFQVSPFCLPIVATHMRMKSASCAFCMWMVQNQVQKVHQRSICAKF